MHHQRRFGPCVDEEVAAAAASSTCNMFMSSSMTH
jgi:hypothetical protein